MSDKQYSNHDDRTELEKALVSTKPWFEQHGTTLIYGLAAVIGIAAVVVYLQRKNPGEAPEAAEFMVASTPEEYRDIADDYSDSTLGVWARLKQADQLLGNGISNMFTDRETALNELDQAEAAYNQLGNRSDVNDAIQERVLIGLARITETRCDGTEESVNAAVNGWKALLNKYEDSLVREYAESRIDRLADESAREFYTWFHAQNPSPDDPLQMPSDGPGEVPDIPLLPGLGNLTPGANEGADGSGDSSTDSENTTTPEGGTGPESGDTEEPKGTDSTSSDGDATKSEDGETETSTAEPESSEAETESGEVEAETGSNGDSPSAPESTEEPGEDQE